jgi:predicted metalloprotease with PDZ domain
MITYRISATEPNAHHFSVTLTIANPAPEQRLSLPVWVPGSYLVREFARHLSALSATQGTRTLPLQQLDKATWLARCSGRGALVVRYRVYAFDTSVRAAFLDANRGFFNGTGVCLRVEGSEALPHRIELKALPAGWQVATAMPALKVDAAGRGTYEAANYDELVDHPVELGRFWRGHFTARGVPHEYIVANALPDFDGERLLADAKRICEAQIAFWHGPAARPSRRSGAPAATKPPFERYVFLHNLIEDGHGGLEHRASTALISSRRDMPARRTDTRADPRAKPETSDGYANVLGLISHEYFHTWNVKRLRPAEFTRYDYTQENYTELLWFFEGFTSYYDDLFLLRDKLIDLPRYLKLVARTASGVLASPGRKLQSVAQASFDSWVKYYRADENTPNATISYYTKGSLVALALDLTLRSEGHGTLDDVMRRLWAVSAGGPRSEGGPITEAQISDALQHVGRRSFAPELAAWVHGTADLPLPALLARFGVAWGFDAATLAQRLGLRVSESALTGVKATHVLHGGAAEQAGLAPGDEIMAVNGWRIRRLEDATRLVDATSAGTRAKAGAAKVPLLVARDQRVLTLALELPSASEAGNVSLKADAKAAAPALALQQAWLAG